MTDRPNTDRVNLTRRAFLRGTAVGGGALLGAQWLSLAERAFAVPVSAVEQWNYTADVVVVGFGGAGTVAASAAHDAGAKVLVLEKQSQSMHTPNTKMCGGLVHYATDVADAERYFRAVAFGEGLPEGWGDPDEAYPKYPKAFADEIAKTWAEGVVRTKEWMEATGAPVGMVQVPKAAFPDFPGAANYGTFHVVGQAAGKIMFEAMEQEVHRRGIQVLWETPGRQLVVNPSGEIVGVIAENDGRRLAIKARRAVILTTGGYECDEEMKKAFLPGWKWVFMGSPANNGDGIRMAMGVGAALGHMHHAAARVVAGDMYEEIGTGIRIPVDAPGMILVDNYGHRFANEEFTATDPQRYQFYNMVTNFDPTRLEYARIPSWLIMDAERVQRGPVASTNYGAHTVGIYEWSKDNRAEIDRGWILEAPTLGELAQKIATHPRNKGRMTASELAKTVEMFNRHAANREDPDFGRSRGSLGPVSRAPYYAVAMYPGGPNTEGGPIRNARGQVIDVFGQPIPRLYGAGEMGSVFSFAYQGGGNVAELLIFGRIAGRNAAAESAWS